MPNMSNTSPKDIQENNTKLNMDEEMKLSFFELGDFVKFGEFLQYLIGENSTVNELQKLSDNYYLINDFSTIVVGAKDNSKTLHRFYRGLPEILVNKPDLENKLDSEHADKDLELGRIIFLSAFDIFYEVKKKGKSVSEGEPVSSGSFLLDSSGREELIKVSEYRLKLKGFELLKKVNNFKMMIFNPRISKLLKEGEENRDKGYIEKWEEYSRKYDIPISN